MAVELREFSWQRMIEAVKAALESVGFVHATGMDITEREQADEYHVVALEPLVWMKLNSFRRKDQVHLQDLISLGLVDASWLPRCIPEHAARLQQLLDDPEG